MAYDLPLRTLFQEQLTGMGICSLLAALQIKAPTE
jgi:hypothetical protein